MLEGVGEESRRHRCLLLLRSCVDIIGNAVCRSWMPINLEVEGCIRCFANLQQDRNLLFMAFMEIRI